MKRAMREAWFLVVPGMLLLFSGFRDLLFRGGADPPHFQNGNDGPITVGAGLLFLIGSYAFLKTSKIRGSVVVALTGAIVLVFPLFIANDRTYWAWIAVCFTLFLGAVYQSFRRHRV